VVPSDNQPILAVDGFTMVMRHQRTSRASSPKAMITFLYPDDHERLEWAGGLAFTQPIIQRSTLQDRRE
jgi:hypothetical protein